MFDDDNSSHPVFYPFLFKFKPIHAYLTISLSPSHIPGIPITRQERMGSDRAGAWEVGGGSWPLVFAGGPTATSNPEPFR